jgi:hypothetical protein
MTATKKATKRGKKIANLKARRGKSVIGGTLLEAATKGTVFKKVAIHVTA